LIGFWPKFCTKFFGKMMFHVGWVATNIRTILLV
jgi:hypothetical protein